MCKRFCALFFYDDMSECCCLAMAPSVVLFCALQIIIGILYLSFPVHGVPYSLIVFLSVISSGDALTGICAVCTSNYHLAFGALMGFFVEFFIHTIVIILRWVHCLMLIAKALQQGHSMRDRHLGKDFWNMLGLFFESFVILTISYFVLKVNYSYYRVVQLGGDGWERKSPKDINDDLFEDSSGKVERLDSYEAQRLLDPEAELYKF